MKRWTYYSLYLSLCQKPNKLTMTSSYVIFTIYIEFEFTLALSRILVTKLLNYVWAQRVVYIHLSKENCLYFNLRGR